MIYIKRFQLVCCSMLIRKLIFSSGLKWATKRLGILLLIEMGECTYLLEMVYGFCSSAVDTGWTPLDWGYLHVAAGGHQPLDVWVDVAFADGNRWGWWLVTVVAVTYSPSRWKRWVWPPHFDDCYLEGQCLFSRHDVRSIGASPYIVYSIANSVWVRYLYFVVLHGKLLLTNRVADDCLLYQIACW